VIPERAGLLLAGQRCTALAFFARLRTGFFCGFAELDSGQ